MQIKFSNVYSGCDLNNSREFSFRLFRKNMTSPPTQRRFFQFILLCGLISIQTLKASAQTYQQAFQRPDFRNKPQTQWAIWDNFQSAVGNNSPDIQGSSSSASIVQTFPSGVILTGSGNIYGLDNPPKFILNDTVPYQLTRVVLQVRIVGKNINLPGVVLNAGGRSFKPAVTVLETGDANSPFGGGAFSTKFTWNLAGAGVQSYSIEFNGIEPHTSLDAASLDTAGPLPGVFAAQFDAAPSPLIDKSEILLTGSVMSEKTIQQVRLRRVKSKSSAWIPATFEPTNMVWSVQMPLEYGKNVIMVQAVDSNGKKSKKAKTTLYRVLVR